MTLPDDIAAGKPEALDECLQLCLWWLGTQARRPPIDPVEAITALVARVRALTEAWASVQASIDQHIVALNAVESRVHALTEERDELQLECVEAYSRAESAEAWIESAVCGTCGELFPTLGGVAHALASRRIHLGAEREYDPADADVIPRKDYVITTPYPKDEQNWPDWPAEWWALRSIYARRLRAVGGELTPLDREAIRRTTGKEVW